ncbi:MAG TPA: universal stress protein [Verrucomicrobiales bacterium]|jgi:nucleotide-binding universal stress UspA family protein|nr:universal stress protein [Verrucomicrobiales bacterium]
MKLLAGYDASPAAVAAVHDLQNAGLPESGEALLLGFSDLFLPPVPPDAPFNSMEINAVAARREAEVRRDALLAETQNAALLLKESLPGWTVRAEADIDAPASGLLSRAAEWQPDLLCIGAPHSSRMERLFFGSVCARVVAHAACSVRIGRTEGHGRPLKLMLASDGSADSMAAADTILARRWPAGTEVVIVSVLDSRFTHFAGTMLSPVAGEPEDGMLNGMTARFKEAGLAASFSTVSGVPKAELLKAAAEWGVHCIFAGASGSGALERLIMGSVSSALAERAACSVEICRRVP